MDGEPVIRPAADASGEPRTLRAGRARGHRPRREVDPGLGPRPPLQHAREPAGLVHLAPARLGCADSGGRLREVRRGDPDGGRSSNAPRRSSTSTAPTPGTSGRSKSSSPPGLTCPACGGTEFERERDILDVWFDSGSSHEAVLPFRDELTWPADMYLEGSDQHRGWFQSSLLVGLGTRGRPPFREVLTHGFLIDVDGRKMSKSLGNTILPQEVIKESGAETLRLVGRDERLPGGAAGRQADPAASRRGLPQDPEHRAAICWRTSTTSIRRATWCRCGDAGGGSLRARALRGRSARRPRRLRRLRFPDDLPADQPADHGRPRRPSMPMSRRIGFTPLRPGRAGGVRRRRRCT